MPELDVPVPGEQIEVGPFGSPVVYRIISRYASVAARDAAAPTPGNGEPCYVQDIDEFQIYDGSSWVKQSPGIVTAGSGISVTGTAPDWAVAHADTSAQGSVDNSGDRVIQDVDLDGFGHVTGLESVDLWRPRYEFDEFTGSQNIGTGYTAMSKAFTIPASGLVVMNWQAQIARNAASLSDTTLTVIPRRDAVNVDTYGRYSDIKVSDMMGDDGDEIGVSGTTYWVEGASATPTYSLFFSKAGAMSLTLKTANMSLFWIDTQG